MYNSLEIFTPADRQKRGNNRWKASEGEREKFLYIFLRAAENNTRHITFFENLLTFCFMFCHFQLALKGRHGSKKNYCVYIAGE
jgi:hypothetical protein